MGMTLDTSDFEQGFKGLIKNAVPREIAQGMFRATNALLRDAIEEPPQAPFDEGSLRGSARVMTPDGAMYSRETATPPAGNMGTSAKDDDVVMVAGFNIEYAARLHELSPADSEWINWTRTGAKQPGSQYLITKMARNSARYLAIVGEHLRALLGGG